jgi:cobalt-zinc-cadmium efflux system outer membrane protein
VHNMTTALVVVGTLGLATTTRAEPITIQQALERASHRASVVLADFSIDAAKAHTRGARLPLYNPELRGSVGPQFGSGTPSLLFELGVSQAIERGGKRAARISLADALTKGTEIDKRAESIRVRVEAWRAFERSLVMADRLATQREVETLALALAGAMQKSVLAGGTTKLRVNVVVAEAGRATQLRIAAESDYAAARAALATSVGGGAVEQLDPAGGGSELPDVSARVDELVARALREHPEISAAENGLAVANARVVEADARGTVDVTIGLGYAYAADPNGANAVVASIAIPLAVRNRNEGEREAARVGTKRAAVERTYERIEIERAARLAVENYQRAREAVAGFDREVTNHLGENLAAAQDAFAKGGLDFVELTTTQRDLIASRLAFLDARLAAIDAWAELALATTMEVKP